MNFLGCKSKKMDYQQKKLLNTINGLSALFSDVDMASNTHSLEDLNFVKNLSPSVSLKTIES